MDAIPRARSLYAAGRLREAGDLLNAHLKLHPADAEATHLFASIVFQLGNTAEGRRLAERAVGLDPGNAAAWNTLGLILHLAGENPQALEAFERATVAAPSYGEAWMNRAFVLQVLGRHGESIEFLLKALAAQFETPSVHFFLGNAYAAAGDQQEAIKAFDRAIAMDRDFADAWNNRGNSLLALGEVEEGSKSLERAALLLAAEVKELDRLGQSSPEHVAKRADLVRILQQHGRWRDALNIVKGAREDELKYLHALTMPVVFESSAMIREALEHLKVSVKRLREQRPRLADPLRQVGLTAFNLTYFGVSDRPIQESIGQLYIEAAPILGFSASHSPRPGRIRLGVISSLLTEHTISRVYGGLIERLDRERFEVVFLQVGAGDACSERLAASVDRHVMVPSNLAEAQQAVAREELGILFYPEVGIDPLTYYLAFSRLAPVQCVTWGHPMTTGSPAMDYFITSEHLEREDGQSEYTEKLVRLPSLTVFYKKPEPPPPLPKSAFGLPDDRRLYGCPQTAFKLHPDFDRVLARILEQDDRGSVVLIEPERPYFKKILIDRWERTHPILAQRAIWLRQMPLERFLRLLQLCDALLAPIQFGAGRSTLDAFAVGAPVVTFKGAFLKSRITYAAYAQVGMHDLVAESEEEYVQLALRLAKDEEWQTQMRQAISERAEPLFESKNAVRELNDFFGSLS